MRVFDPHSRYEMLAHIQFERIQSGVSTNTKKHMKRWFELREKLSRRSTLLIGFGGAVFFTFLWWLTIETGLISPQMLPKPWAVVSSFPELYFENDLVRNAIYSIKLNLGGYLEAIVIAVPIGFLTGLFPFFRALFGPYLTAFRYLPLTALVGVFILWFGLGSVMKVHFLALGILVYLLPIVVQRIDEVQEIYISTVKTIGATKWQTIRKVFIPDVFSRLWDDIRVIVAISWTYIIIAEVVNMGDGGIGASIYLAARQTRPDKVFALLLVIILIGFLQDMLFKWLDRQMFPHKYA